MLNQKAFFVSAKTEVGSSQGGGVQYLIELFFDACDGDVNADTGLEVRAEITGFKTEE